MIELPGKKRGERYSTLGAEDDSAIVNDEVFPYRDNADATDDDDEYGIPTNALRSEYQREQTRPRSCSRKWLLVGGILLALILFKLKKNGSTEEPPPGPGTWALDTNEKTPHNNIPHTKAPTATPHTEAPTAEPLPGPGKWDLGPPSTPKPSPLVLPPENPLDDTSNLDTLNGLGNNPDQQGGEEQHESWGDVDTEEEDMEDGETTKEEDTDGEMELISSGEGDEEGATMDDEFVEDEGMEEFDLEDEAVEEGENGEPTPDGGIWGVGPKEKESGTVTSPPEDNNSLEEESNLPEPTAKPSESPANDEDTELDTKEENDSISSIQEGAKQPTAPYLYRRRGKQISTKKAEELAAKWGQWDFVDLKANERPNKDYCGQYPNRDIPWSDFPPNAWQVDEEHVSKFLAAGKDLVLRAMEVHLAEYGFGPDDIPGDDFESRVEQSPFAFEIVKDRRQLSTGVNDRAGWAPQKSWDGLVRRLLHAVVSGSDFNLVLGGHSAAAGHGNHFQQSYSLQFQRVMEPVFARLGVKHYSRNTGMGGLGTIQSVMGARDIYGSDVDILMWDSSMTEGSASPDFDLFARQGILGSDRAPLLWAGIDDENLYPTLQEHADIDYMMYGTGKGPVPELIDPTKVDEIPWAARYIKCDPDWTSLCEDNRYNGTCWIPRDDFEPWTPQNDELGGKASWHDGNREHQLYGRTMSFTVLRALYEALDLWDVQPNHVLSDDMWHMTDYYANIHHKIANLDPTIGNCYEIEERLPTAWCTTPFQSRTEFTPRANPAETSIRSIMKPFGPDASLPEPELNIYDPPDVYNPAIGVPEGAIDYLAIIENGVDYAVFDAPVPVLPGKTTSNRLIELTVDDHGEEITPGLGWGINTKASPHLCNGTYDSFCGRSGDHQCLLYGHNDHRGGLTFDSFSGWGIFTLTNVKEGKIFVKMDSWRPAKDNPVTEGWTAENNGTGVRSLTMTSAQDKTSYNSEESSDRRAKEENQNFCPDFVLEFAFGDNIVRIPSEEVLGERHSLVQRVVQIWTVLDDPGFTEGETMDIELGIRLRGCGRQHVFWLSTIYWI